MLAVKLSNVNMMMFSKSSRSSALVSRFTPKINYKSVITPVNFFMRAQSLAPARTASSAAPKSKPSAAKKPAAVAVGFAKKQAPSKPIAKDEKSKNKKEESKDTVEKKDDKKAEEKDTVAKKDDKKKDDKKKETKDAAKKESKKEDEKKTKKKEEEEEEDDEKEDDQKHLVKAVKRVKDAIRVAVTLFSKADLAYGQGSHDPVNDAYLLVLSELKLRPTHPATEELLDCKLTKPERKKLVSMIQSRIADRKPSAYLTQTSYFGDFEFYVDERAIIPRSLIAEVLVDSGDGFHLPTFLAQNGIEVKRVLDLCTGSGALAVMAGAAFPEAQIDASDVSTKALEVAKRNITDYHLDDRVSLIHSNMFEKLQGKKYDLILVNPPYVTEKAYKALPHEYRHEPKEALVAGADGLTFLRQILSEAPKLLTSSGSIIVEAGRKRAVLEQLLAKEFPKYYIEWLPVSVGSEDVFRVSLQPPKTLKKGAPAKKALPPASSKGQ